MRDWLEAADWHVRNLARLTRLARSLDRRPRNLRSWPGWLERNERLVREGRAILGDPGTYGDQLDRIKGSRGSLRSTMSLMERFTPGWEDLYDRLARDWDELVARAGGVGLPLPLVRGYDELIGRVHDLADHPQLPSDERQELTELLDYHRGETAARRAVHDYLDATERHVKGCEPLQREAQSRGVHVAEVAGWPEWPHEAQRLERAGQAILAGEDTYGPYLDAIAAGKPRARQTIDRLRSRIEDGRVEATGVKKPPHRREPVPGQRDGIAWILDDPGKLRELREQLKKRERRLAKRMQRSRGRSM